MAFITRLGIPNWPAAGETIAVYVTGTLRNAGNLVSGLKNVEGGDSLTNPFTIPSGEFLKITTSDFARIDIWWVEGNMYLVEGAIIRSQEIEQRTDDPLSPELNQMWLLLTGGGTDGKLCIKTSAGILRFAASQFIAD